MNIMKFMRSSKFLYFLLWLVILSFVIWVFAIYGGAGQSLRNPFEEEYIVKVKKRSLSPAVLNLSLQYHRENIRNMLGEQYVEQFMKDAHKMMVSNFVDNLIIEDILDEMGMGVTPAEIGDFLKERYGFSDPEFYKKFLESRGVTAKDFERFIGVNLARKKFDDFVYNCMIMTEKEALSQYKKENSKLKTKVFVIRNKNFLKDIPPISEEEVRALYEEKKETLNIPEKRSIKYVFLSPAMLRMSIEIPEEEMKNYYEANKKRFGDKPFDMVKNQVRNLMLFSDEKYKNRTKEIYEAAKKELKKLKEDKEIEEFAKKYKMEVRTSSPMTKDAPEMFIANNKEAVNAIFDGNRDKWSEIFESETGVIKFKIIDIIHQHQATFEEVKKELEDEIKEKKAKELALKSVNELKFLYKDSKNFEEEVKKRNFQSADSEEISLSKPVLPLIGNNEEIVLKTFESERDVLNGPFSLSDGYALTILKEKTLPDIDKFEKEKEKFIRDKRMEKAQSYIKDLLALKRKEFDSKNLIKVNIEYLKRYEPTSEG